MGAPPLLRFFAYEHLPPKLQEISKPFHDLAVLLWERGCTDSDERDMAFRKLLEAKDCAVRASL